MKLAIEYIEQFTRGKNPFKTLKIGKRAQIDNWFKTWAPHTKYEINDNFKIYIKEFLNLYSINISEMPNNLYINEWLDLRKTNINSLPNNLYVGGWLDIRSTKIISLPDNLYVKGTIFKYFK